MRGRRHHNPGLGESLYEWSGGYHVCASCALRTGLMDMCLVRVIHYVLSFGNGLKRYLRELLADDQEVGLIVFRSV